MVTLTGEVWRLFHCRTLRTAVHIASFDLASAGRMGTLSGCRDILAHGRFALPQTPIPFELKSVGGQTGSWSERVTVLSDSLSFHLLGTFCKLVVNDLDFYSQPRMYGILQKQFKEQIPLGFQFFAISFSVVARLWHAGYSS